MVTNREFPSVVTVDAALTVRLAQDSDAELISGWTRAAEVNRLWAGRVVPVEEVLAKYTGRRSPRVASYVVTEHGTPVGYLQAWQEADRCGLDMFLSAGAQGRGIGPRAARAIATELTAHGWVPLTADPAVDNPRAVRAWLAAGFVPTGELGVDDNRTTQVMEFQRPVSEPSDAVRRAVEANTRHRPVEVGPDVVLRPAGPSTETVHGLLRHIRGKGLDCVPEPLAVEGSVETLRFIPGEDGGRGWFHQHTDQGLASAARLLRTIHDAGADWTPPDGAVWGAHPVPGEQAVFCHGDPGPWNFIWQDNEAIALIDWDYLHPGPRLDDVAYALRWFAPLRSDEHATNWHHFPAVPDRRARVRTFIEAYGDLPAFDVVDVVSERIRAVISHRRLLAEQGVEPQRTWVADGAEERDLEEIEWIQAHRGELTPPPRGGRRRLPAE